MRNRRARAESAHTLCMLLMSALSRLDRQLAGCIDAVRSIQIDGRHRCNATARRITGEPNSMQLLITSLA